MKIAVIGNGLQAFVAAALFASVGNRVTLLGANRLPQEFKNEPGLNRLWQDQMQAARLKFGGDKSASIAEQSETFAMIVLAEVSIKSLLTKHYSTLLASLKAGVDVVIMSPSEIGEAQMLAKILQKEGASTTVSCVPLMVREGRALDDFSRPKSIIVGCDSNATLDKIRSLFFPFNRVADVIKPVTTKEAEFASFASLAMLATRLSFMNEMASLAERTQVDIDVVRECIGSDPRIGRDYLYPGCGYGGKVLADYVDKMAHQMQLRSDDLGLLNIVTRINERQKDLLFRKIWSYFSGELAGKSVAIWGAAFKPGSASIEGAPSIKLIDELLAHQVKIKIYDPSANQAIRDRFADQQALQVVESAYLATDDVDVLAICTEWKEFWSPDFEKLRAGLAERAIFDGRNILSPTQVQSSGFRYFGIGRGERVTKLMDD